MFKIAAVSVYVLLGSASLAAETDPMSLQARLDRFMQCSMSAGLAGFIYVPDRCYKWVLCKKLVVLKENFRFARGELEEPELQLEQMSASQNAKVAAFRPAVRKLSRRAGRLANKDVPNDSNGSMTSSQKWYAAWNKLLLLLLNLYTIRCLTIVLLVTPLNFAFSRQLISVGF